MLRSEAFGSATGVTWEGVHRALTREPGDLPAWVAQCQGPGKGRGTEVSVERRPSGWSRFGAGAAGITPLACLSIGRSRPTHRQAPPSLPASGASHVEIHDHFLGCIGDR